MPDLHGWITQQIDHTEAVARAATPGPWTAEPFAYGKPQDGWGPPSNFEIDSPTTQVVTHQPHEGGGIHHGPNADHIALHDPAAVLRRCTADRKILARHRLDPDVIWTPACHGCGTYGDMELPETENLNDCPELLDLAHAHGLTDEALAALDRPQTPERPPSQALTPGESLFVASLRHMAEQLHAAPPVRNLTPLELAIGILDPHLRRCALYQPGPPALRGPNWKARP